MRVQTETELLGGALAAGCLLVHGVEVVLGRPGYTHFPDRETEAQGVYRSFQKSHSSLVIA